MCLGKKIRLKTRLMGKEKNNLNGFVNLED